MRALRRSERTAPPRPGVEPAVVERLQVLLQALDATAPVSDDAEALLARAARALRGMQPESIWLALAVLGARLPETADVVSARRLGELSGAEAVVAHAIERMGPESPRALVEVAQDEVLVDVNHLARTTLSTGIQRVTHQTVRRWHRDHPVSFVVWTDDEGALRRTTAAETARTVGVPAGDGRQAADQRPTVVVPWRSRYVLPEVALEVPRTKRLQALALYSRCQTSAIGFDAVPLTSSETTDTHVPAYFMHELAAIRHMDRVATISQAALVEYTGWRTMVSSLGVAGPHIEAVPLPVEATEPAPAAISAARSRYCVPSVPMVLCVGSHEPRKNHLAVLHAAEILWRTGLQFTLLFVGGNTWNSSRFQRRLGELTDAGRPVESVLGLPDETLWALYRLARCTVFPSLNEGFGLPVAESLASGTPAVTSDFGSMREIGAGGGALLVDPRDDHSVAAAIRTLLTDDLTHARLVREAAARPQRTWDHYAAEAWVALTGDTGPTGRTGP